MYDDHDDADDVNRTPTAFARRNYQQPESYKSSLQKHQAYHGHTGKAMTGPGFDKSIADSAKALMMSIEHQQLLPGEIINNQSPISQGFKSIKHIMETRARQ